MLNNNGQETSDSGKMLAFTLALTNFLLLAVVLGVFWLAQAILSEVNQLNQFARGFNLM
jgi:hypothetical protein